MNCLLDSSKKGLVVNPLKNKLLLVLLIVVSVIVGVLISSAVYSVTGFSLFGGFHDLPLPAGDVRNADLSSLAYSVLEDIKAGDYDALSRVAHPELGVLFSPQATIAESANKRFSAEEIASFGADTNVYVWGVYSASGEPIEMTPTEYFARFVFSKDFTSAPFVGINRVIRSGNALENIYDVFPDMQFVEFNMPGGEQDPADDFGWCTLRLGFEEYNGSLWLSAIIHSEWTV